MTALATLRGSRPTPDDLQELESYIRRRYRGLLLDLQLEVVGTCVVLHGRATSFYGKQMAQQEVLNHGGLSILANRIAVRPDQPRE